MSEVEVLREQNKQSREQLEEAAALLKRLAADPHTLATVVEDDPKNKTMLLARGSEFISVIRPTKDIPKIGQTVLVRMDTNAIVRNHGNQPTGSVAHVTRFDNGQEVEINFGGAAKLALIASGVGELKAGDRVLVDANGSVVLRVLPPEKEHKPPQRQCVTWDDIGGQGEAKHALIEAVELPHKYPDIFARYGKKPCKGVLLYGPPGCGKTMLGKAVATSLAASHGSTDGEGGFMYIKGPELLNKYVGETEASIRELFKTAREYKAKHGHAAVIFIDEADAILGRRGGHHQSFMASTVVPMFLTEMDGMDEQAALVILATNRPDALDPAAVRDGRIDRRIRVARPTRDDAEHIAQLYLAKVPMTDALHDEAPVTPALLAALLADLLYNGLPLNQVTFTDGTTATFCLHHLASGALIENLVDQATSLALHRDIASGKPSGVSRVDIAQAISKTLTENRHTDHSDALEDFAGARSIHRTEKVHDAAAG